MAQSNALTVNHSSQGRWGKAIRLCVDGGIRDPPWCYGKVGEVVPGPSALSNQGQHPWDSWCRQLARYWHPSGSRQGSVHLLKQCV